MQKVHHTLKHILKIMAPMLQTVKLENYYKNDSVLSWNQQIIMHLQNTTSWNIL